MEMALPMKIEKQSNKFIKPFVPTPQTLRHYKLGLIDEVVPAIDVGIILFFCADSYRHAPKYVASLEKSLEKMLTQFYPLAGRYNEETNSIDCNDQGAEFIHAKVSIKLQDVLGSDNMNVNFLDEFIPSKIGDSHQYNDPLLAMQVTAFECGGVALGVSAIHKLVDASTLCTFINEWADMNREENETKYTIRSFFNSSSFFPGRNLRPLPLESMSDDVLKKYTKIKLSFSGSVISKLRSIKGKTSMCHRSKVQVVAAIIWKTLINVDKATHNFSRGSTLIQSVNLRGKMASLIPDNSCGNLWGMCATKSTTLETTEELTDCLSASIKKTVTNFSKVCHNSDVLDTFLQLINIYESTNVITLSSWCKFPFYEADFGFGKPIWVAPGTMPIKNSAYLMDDAGGNGVEAYLFLEVKDVTYFKEALDHLNAFFA